MAQSRESTSSEQSGSRGSGSSGSGSSGERARGGSESASSGGRLQRSPPSGPTEDGTAHLAAADTHGSHRAELARLGITP